ncbi:ABC transporter permease [Pararhizobium mangrovi]|uniref:ABC transporter permease n=1 Tax=Pararhizobium mangrovi TaxID=2590452 RepID=A0A506U4I1_9HYPH|nr:ABC transporter permease [Pararhizobium mangrovi]TPW26787.1 ABC transporter permease [Pararhizobium mangrovi]
MRLEIERRATRSSLYAALSPFIALALTVVAGGIMFAALGKDPFSALYSFFIAPLTSAWSLNQLAIKSAPLILIAVGLSVCFSSRNWNIGAEGQFIAGALMGSILPVMAPDWTSPLLLPIILVLGMVGGALYAAIPAILKAEFNANEILSSLMLVYVAQLFLDWTVRGPWRDPQGFNFPQTIQFSDSATLPPIYAGGAAHWGFVFALVAAVVTWFMLRRTLKGFEIRVLGESSRAGRFAGFSSRRMVYFSFLFSGALAGLAGICEVSGAINQLQPVISPGYGFTAIIVAFLGRLNPLSIVVAGLVLGLTYLGGEAAQITIGLSEKVARVFQGFLLFFVLGCDTLILYRIRLVSSRRASGEEAAQ